MAVGDTCASSADVGAATVTGTSVGGIVVGDMESPCGDDTGSGAFDPQAVSRTKVRVKTIREIFMVNAPKFRVAIRQVYRQYIGGVLRKDEEIMESKPAS